MKIALVADWLDLYGGAERVLTILDEEFKFTEVACMVDVMNELDKKKVFTSSKIINTSSLQITRNKFRLFFPLFPIFVRQLKVSDKNNIIITSSHTAAKGFIKKNINQLNICYIQQRNLMYVWEDYERKLFFKWFRYPLLPLLELIRYFDFLSAQKPDYLVANSLFVQNWIKKRYKRDSYLIYPCVEIDKFEVVIEKEEYYVTVGRFALKKRFDLIIEAFNQNKKRLIVVGDGDLMNDLKERANANIEFTGFLKTEEISKIVGKAKGFIFAALEDFGIAPVEAQACGTPVICYGRGGTAETIIHKKTGYLFDKQEVNSIVLAIEEFEKLEFNPYELRANAEKFNKERFKNEFRMLVNKLNKSSKQ